MSFSTYSYLLLFVPTWHAGSCMSTYLCICPYQLVPPHTYLFHTSFSMLMPTYSWAYLATHTCVYTHSSIPISHGPCLPAPTMLILISSCLTIPSVVAYTCPGPPHVYTHLPVVPNCPQLCPLADGLPTLVYANFCLLVPVSSYHTCGFH